METERVCSKINLFLAIVGKQPTGFHNLISLVSPIDIYDEVSAEFSDVDEIVSNVDIKDNIITKALNIYREKTNVDKKVKFTLKKEIPIGAGLGGESADAVASLKVINRLFGDLLDNEELIELGLTLGSDTFFFYEQKTSLLFDRGDRLIYVDSPTKKEYTLFIPDIVSLTKEVFANYHYIPDRKHEKNANKIMRSYLNGMEEDFFKSSYNDLTDSILITYPKLKPIYNKIKGSFKDAIFTGSGSSIIARGHQSLEIDGVLTKKITIID